MDVYTSYPGGKQGSGVFQKIINQMPPHRVYVEGFLGGGAIMRMKRPALASIGIDADDAAISAARVWGVNVPNLTLIRGDAIAWLSANHTLGGDVLVYLDPPYLMSVRSSQRPIYRCEISEADHVRLLQVIKGLACMVVISGYWSELYERELKGWRVETFQTTNRGGGLATEYLWMNFQAPLELHDYRYLGRNFRERERIKRKKQRWVKRLAGMGSLERYALMEVIGELRRSCSAGDGDVVDHAESGDGDVRIVGDGDSAGSEDVGSAEHAKGTKGTKAAAHVGYDDGGSR